MKVLHKWFFCKPTKFVNCLIKIAPVNTKDKPALFRLRPKPMSEGLSGGWLSAIALGLVEGLSEFLPISSTGHLIIAAHWLGENSESAKLFEVSFNWARF